MNILGIPTNVAAALTLAIHALLFAIAAKRLVPILEPTLIVLTTLAVALSTLITGAPGLRYGTSWVSVTNGDFLSYALSSAYFASHGFYQIPTTLTAHGFFASIDASATTWPLYSLFGERAGFNELLAAASTVAQMDTIHVYMAVGMFTVLLLGFSVAAACTDAGPLVSSIAFLTTTTSAATLHAYYHQLLPQVLGIAISVALCAAFRDIFAQPYPKARLRGTQLIASILFGAELVTYSESIPVFILALATCGGLYTLRNFSQIRDTANRIILPIAGGLLCAISFTPNILNKYSHGLGATVGTRSSTNYPYYLVPSGLANFWGLMPLNELWSEPFLSLSIASGAALLMLLTIIAILGAFKTRLYCTIVLVYIVLAIYFFVHSSDFGLYKAAMYVEPFVICLVVEATLLNTSNRNLRRQQTIGACILVALALMSIPSSRSEWRAEFEQHGAILEVPGATAYRLIDQLKSARPEIQNRPLVSLDSNPDLYWYASYATPFIAHYYPTSIDIGDVRPVLPGIVRLPYYNDINDTLGRMAREQRHFSVTRSFRLQFGEHKTPIIASFPTSTIEREMDIGKALVTSPHLSVLNNHEMPDGRDIALIPFKNVSNELVLVDSNLGVTQGWKITEPGSPTALYPEEADYFFPDSFMSAMGRYMLFEVVHPTGKLRLRMALTETLSPVGDNVLPIIKVIGKSLVLAKNVGQGSARLVTPPFETLNVDGHHVFVLEIARPPFRFLRARPGLMGTYGRDVSIDTKTLSAFVRNLSLEPAAGATPKPPSGIRTFPADLANRALIYSGCFESGWLSRSSRFYLYRPAGTRLHVRGSVPSFKDNFSTRLMIAVNGRRVLTKDLFAGLFQANITLPQSQGIQKLEFTFSADHVLGPKDPKRASLLLSSLWFD